MPIFQLTGLSGAGKTTLATQVIEKLQTAGIAAELIDGDVYRSSVCKDLGFSKADRLENIRRLGVIAHEFHLEGKVVIIAAINPFQEARGNLEKTYGAKTIWINCSLDILKQRDTKGLYEKAALPDDHPLKLHFLTGVSDPYEIPINAHLVLNTGLEEITESVEKIFQFILGATTNN